MSAPTASDGQSRVILCGTDNPQPGTHPYVIGYIDMVDGYRHAWAETNRFGRTRIRRSRTAAHPDDPRCPECYPHGDDQLTTEEERG